MSIPFSTSSLSLVEPLGYNVKIICGNANPKLAEDVAAYLGIPLTPASVKRFADGEVGVQILENVRGCDVFIVQPTSPPVNDRLMELLLITDALRRASAKRITAVIPYFGYARQDRKTQSRVPISAALVAQLVEAAGVHRVLSVDLHCGQIQGFFRIPVDNLFAAPWLMTHFKSRTDLVKPVVVSPDAGGAERADKFRQCLEKEGIKAGMALINKTRKEANKIERMELVGSVDGADAIIVDDIIDTAGTLCKAAELLKQSGARRVFAAATHALFSGPAHERVSQSPHLDGVVVTNTIAQSGENTKLVEVSIANLLGEAIRRVHTEESVSSIFS